MRMRVVGAALGLVTTLSLLAWTTTSCLAAEDATCASGMALAQLRRAAITHMQADQMLNDMTDLDKADLALSHVETVRKPEGSVACKAVLTLSVMYGGGLRRTIDNDVTYDLLTRGEDRHLAVKIHKLATVF